MYTRISAMRGDRVRQVGDLVLNLVVDASPGLGPYNTNTDNGYLNRNDNNTISYVITYNNSNNI